MTACFFVLFSIIYKLNIFEFLTFCQTKQIWRHHRSSENLLYTTDFKNLKKGNSHHRLICWLFFCFGSEDFWQLQMSCPTVQTQRYLIYNMKQRKQVFTFSNIEFLFENDWNDYQNSCRLIFCRLTHLIIAALISPQYELMWCYLCKLVEYYYIFLN